MRFPLVTATRVSSRCRASINMRVVIIITPGAPWRAKQKGRDCPEQTAAVDRVRMKENVIAACGPRPVLDGHAVFVTTSGGRASRRVGDRRAHVKPYAAATSCGANGRSTDPRGRGRRTGAAVERRLVAPLFHHPGGSPT